MDWEQVLDPGEKSDRRDSKSKTSWSAAADDSKDHGRARKTAVENTAAESRERMAAAADGGRDNRRDRRTTEEGIAAAQRG